MYISLMAMEKDNFINTVDTEKGMRRSFGFMSKKGEKLDTLHTAEQMRQDIIKAAKIVVGFDILNLTVKPTEANFSEHVWGKKVVTEEFKQSKREQYAKFARMPFNVVFIENYTGGHLVRRNADGVTWTQTPVIRAGGIDGGKEVALVMAQDFVVDPTKFGDDGFISTRMIPSKTFESAAQRGDPAILRSTALFYATQVAESLLFLNVKNAEPQRYKLSKTDTKGIVIPKVFAPYCDYRVLDIYRKNAPIKSLEDLLGRVVRQAKDFAEGRADSRAHLVRGHFKNVHGGLYWWNPFMRNRHRLETHGFADKDYNLKT